MYAAVYTPATLNPEKQHPTQSWIGPEPFTLQRREKHLPLVWNVTLIPQPHSI